MKEHEIVSAVRATTGIPDAIKSEKAVRATLEVLGTRLAGGESGDLAAQLPPALAEVLPAQGPGERFGVMEFYQRVAELEDTDPTTARQHARAVGAALKTALPVGELDDLLAQLPKDYEDVFVTSGPVHH